MSAFPTVAAVTLKSTSGAFAFALHDVEYHFLELLICHLLHSSRGFILPHPKTMACGPTPLTLDRERGLPRGRRRHDAQEYQRFSIQWNAELRW